MQWYSLRNLRQSDLNEISGDIQVPPDSPWFSGHFPDKPILPGIAQLGIIFDIIRRTSKKNLKISGVRRIRFKQIIEPGDRFRVTATPLKGEAGSYSFRILVKDELVCSGVMMFENGSIIRTDIAQAVRASENTVYSVTGSRGKNQYVDG